MIFQKMIIFNYNGGPPDVSMFKLPGYQTFALGASCSSKGGLICYILDSINVSPKLSVKDSNIWEGLFLDLDLDSTTLAVGNIYIDRLDVITIINQ